MFKYVNIFQIFLIFVITFIQFQTAYSQASFLNCNKGAVYEINVQYQYGGKGKATEYKKMFYIIENGNDKSNIVLFEIIPIEHSIPLFEVGGIKWIDKKQYVIGNYCNHQWNELGVILPQTIHAIQEQGEYGERNQDVINKMRWSSAHSYSGESCPVSLYFYGKDYENYNVVPIKDLGNGIMPLNESSRFTSGNYTITRSIRKVEWSEQFTESLYDLGNLFNNRFNHIVQKTKLEYMIEKVISEFVSYNTLGTKFKEKVGEYIRKDNVVNKNDNDDSDGYPSEQYFDKPFDVNRIYNQKPPYPVISNKCYGAHNILYNLNNIIMNSGGMNIGRMAIWDVYKNGEQNKSAEPKQIVNDMQKQMISYSESTKTLSNNISIITSISERIEALKYKIDNLDKLLQLNNDPQLPLLFMDNFISGVSKGSEKVIYDRLSFSFKNYKSDNSYTLQFSDTLGNGFMNPRYMESHAYSIIQRANDNSTQLINQIKDSIKNIGILSKYFIESIERDMMPLKSFMAKTDVITTVNKIKDVAKINKNGFPSFLENDTYHMIQFPENDCAVNLDNLLFNEIGTFVDYLLSTYMTRRFRLDEKDNNYDLDDSDDYIEKRRKIISPSLLKYCSQDEQYGAKIISNMFFLHARKLPNSIKCNMKVLAGIIDDAEVCEILSELFGIDEDDIEDEFEKIVENNAFTLPNFKKMEMFSLVLSRKDPNTIKSRPEISELLQNLYDSLQTEKKGMSKTMQAYEKHVKESDTIITLLSKHSELKTGYTSQSNIKFTNIPESNYSSICNFLSDYNVSRGNNANLYAKGKLLQQTIADLKKVKSSLKSFYYAINNSNASKIDYSEELVTYSPELNNWIILNVQDEIYEDSCVGIGKYMGVGFSVKPGICTLESVFVGGQHIGK